VEALPDLLREEGVGALPREALGGLLERDLVHALPDTLGELEGELVGARGHQVHLVGVQLDELGDVRHHSLLCRDRVSGRAWIRAAPPWREPPPYLPAMTSAQTSFEQMTPITQSPSRMVCSDPSAALRTQGTGLR